MTHSVYPGEDRPDERDQWSTRDQEREPHRTPTVREYRDMLARKRAAAYGIPVAEYLANARREQEKIDRINRLMSSRSLQWDVIEAFARSHGRWFVRGAA